MNQELLDILEQGIEVWNQWRREHPNIRPNLFRANLSGANLSEIDLRGACLHYADLFGANLSEANLSSAELLKAGLSEAYLSGANLSEAYLSGAFLYQADLSGANLSEANLFEANLMRANLSRASLSGANLHSASLGGANLSGASLSYANLTGADFTGADFTGANLSRAVLIGTNLTAAILTDCLVYGIAAWDVELEGAKQDNLVITPQDIIPPPWDNLVTLSHQPTITVDNLEVAQFVYLLLNNQKIRDVINTLTTKSVLILGRFTPDRKAVLDALRNALRQNNYLPILFDFDQPDTRDITETVTTLARLARFIIADLTDAKSIPQELAFIVPHLPSVPVKPLLVSSQREYSMFEHFTKFPWVLPIHRYIDLNDLLASLIEQIIEPAEMKAKELEKR